MNEKTISLDILAQKISQDVVEYIRNWMRVAQAEDIDYHSFRMKFLNTIYNHSTSIEKLNHIMGRIDTKFSFELNEYLSDRIMGEQTARYIFSHVLMALNKEYAKKLEYECDRINTENRILSKRAEELKVKLSHH